MRFQCLLAVGFCLASFASAQGAIQITSSSYITRAFDALEESPISDVFTHESEELFGEIVSGNSLARTSHSNEVGSRPVKGSPGVTETLTMLRWSFQHTRAATEGSFAESRGTLEFTALDDIRYNISGVYSVGSPFAYQRVSLVDENDEVLLSSVNYNEISANEMLSVGSPSGDVSDIVGATGGFLTAGKTYTLNYHYYLLAESSESAASAKGFLEANFVSRTDSSVPEPASVAIWTLGTIGIVAASRCKRRQCRGDI